MNKFSPRMINTVLFLGAVMLILTAMLYFQGHLGLDPCPLCIMQRVAVIFVGVVALIAALHNPSTLGRRIYAGFALLFSLFGAGVSTRHLWLQNLPPDQVPSCGPGLNYVLQNMDLYNTKDILSMLFSGTGDCAQVLWTFLGLSIPGWTLIVFIGMAVVNLWQLLRKY
jgi:disulfide bond formation protein DsbB